MRNDNDCFHNEDMLFHSISDRSVAERVKYAFTVTRKGSSSTLPDECIVLK